MDSKIYYHSIKISVYIHHPQNLIASLREFKLICNLRYLLQFIKILRCYDLA